MRRRPRNRPMRAKPVETATKSNLLSLPVRRRKRKPAMDADAKARRRKAKVYYKKNRPGILKKKRAHYKVNRKVIGKRRKLLQRFRPR